MALDGVSGGSHAKGRSDIPRRLLAPLGRLLSTDDSAATVNRLFVSQHVADLRLILAVSLIGVVLVLLCGVPGALLYERITHPKWSLEVVLLALGAFGTFYAPVLGILGAVLAWAYQAGSARLGVVDLYACEIDTLCRVALVVDSVPRSIETFRQGSPARNGAGNGAGTARHFTSEENYFPVFENNTRDLQALEARVVVNITAFYTYMKAVRDSTRALMDMSASRGDAEPRIEQAAAWEEAARNVIYMMFLGLESGRKAMGDLVEFEPEKAERRAVILISELEAYRFLRQQFVDPEDIKHRRLELREAEYREIVPELCGEIHTGRGATPAEWEPARRLVDELNRRYAAAMGQAPQVCRVAVSASR